MKKKTKFVLAGLVGMVLLLTGAFFSWVGLLHSVMDHSSSDQGGKILGWGIVLLASGAIVGFLVPTESRKP
jgi:hypothetical protein